ncbi:MAG: Succinate dehydrogenase cytochrome b556 subunit [Cellvibrionales bacterium UBA7375]|nr:MAG: Succinate dehydrogenase cytochrome b556 subunit [Cellvibrionales bacterium UBA7375]
MKTKRPVNLDIGSIKLPITSYVSILHRASGVVLFFAVALLLCVFDASLESEQSFESLKDSLTSPVAQFFIWAALAALAYHFVAGIRHLIMDFGIGEDSFESGRNSARVVVIIAIILIASISGWIFLW